jgi:hypothetical protein
LLSVNMCHFLSDLPWCNEEGIVVNTDDLPISLRDKVDSSGHLILTKISSAIKILKQNIRDHD